MYIYVHVCVYLYEKCLLQHVGAYKKRKETKIQFLHTQIVYIEMRTKCSDTRKFISLTDSVFIVFWGIFFVLWRQGLPATLAVMEALGRLSWS